MARSKQINLLCLVDANSYFYMRITELNHGKTLWDYLNHSHKAQFSQVVIAELSRNDGKFESYYQINPDEVLKRSNQVYTFKKNPTHLMQILFGETIVIGEKDAGEKANWAAAVDAYLQKKSVVYISDEDKAIGNKLKDKVGFLQKQLETFPFFPIWNSFDVILHLYTQGILNIDLAQDAITGLGQFFLTIERNNFDFQRKTGDLNKNQYANNIHESINRGAKRRIAYLERLQIIKKSLEI
jgi:hypothetical protein